MSTIADVAILAGVSKATASRALSGRGYVSDETKTRVEAAAHALSYVGNTAATNLATGRTQSVAVILPSLERWFFAELLEGIQETLLAEKYDLALYGVSEGSSARKRLFENILPMRRFDGIIAVGIQPTATEMTQLLHIDRPLVMVGPDNRHASTISIDDVAAARIATEHLIELGHNKIVYIGASEDASAPAADGAINVSNTERMDGYQSAMADAGLASHTHFASAVHTMPGGYAAAAGLLADRRSRPTALIGVCDETAIGALVAAMRLGISVPSELSVVGIDDHPNADMFGLTTIRQTPREQGREAVRLLQDRMERPDSALERIIAPSALIVRSSTAGPR